MPTPTRNHPQPSPPPRQCSGMAKLKQPGGRVLHSSTSHSNGTLLRIPSPAAKAKQPLAQPRGTWLSGDANDSSVMAQPDFSAPQEGSSGDKTKC